MLVEDMGDARGNQCLRVPHAGRVAQVLSIDGTRLNIKNWHNQQLADSSVRLAGSSVFGIISDGTQVQNI